MILGLSTTAFRIIHVLINDKAIRHDGYEQDAPGHDHQGRSHVCNRWLQLGLIIRSERAYVPKESSDG